MDIAAIYARYSSDNQSSESIDAQIRAMKEYAVKNDITIISTYIDEAFSATTDDRPQFLQMIKDSQKKEFNIVLVHKLDRFSRDRYDHAFYKKELKKNKVKVVSVLEKLDDSPESIILESVLEGMSEYYSRNLAREVMKGMNERALKGKHMGQMPYGYYIVDGEVKINPEQADIVRKIFEIYNNGKGHLYIAKWLNEHNIPTYKGGSYWQTTQIRQILKNYKYIGKNVWNGVTYDAEFPGIIDPEVFYLTQNQLNKNVNQYYLRSKLFDKFLLAGLLVCGECGSKMRVKIVNPSKPSRYYAYLCSSASTYRGCKCTKLYRTNILEESVETYINQVRKKKITNIQVSAGESVNTEKITKDRIAKIEKELARAKNAYLNEVFSLEEYKSTKDKLEQEKAVLRQAKAPKEDGNLQIINNINSCWDAYKHARKYGDIIAAKKILFKIIKSIIVFKDHIEVVFYK